MRNTLSLLTLGAALAGGCGGGEGVLQVNFNDKKLEIRSASELVVPKGNETKYRPAEWAMEIRGQDPIIVVCGGQQRSIYTTESVINVDTRGYDLAAGERMIISPDGITVPTQGKPAPSPAPVPTPAPAGGAGAN